MLERSVLFPQILTFWEGGKILTSLVVLVPWESRLFFKNCSTTLWYISFGRPRHRLYRRVDINWLHFSSMHQARAYAASLKKAFDKNENSACNARPFSYKVFVTTHKWVISYSAFLLQRSKKAACFFALTDTSPPCGHLQYLSHSSRSDMRSLQERDTRGEKLTSACRCIKAVWNS